MRMRKTEAVESVVFETLRGVLFPKLHVRFYFVFRAKYYSQNMLKGLSSVQ